MKSNLHLVVNLLLMNTIPGHLITDSELAPLSPSEHLFKLMETLPKTNTRTNECLIEAHIKKPESKTGPTGFHMQRVH